MAPGRGTTCGWLPTISPAVYDCSSRAYPLWKTTCRMVARKYSAHQPDQLSLQWKPCRGPVASAERMMRQLSNRTVVVLGDSNSLNLFCALTCWFSQADGVEVEPLAASHSSGVGPEMRMRHRSGYTMSWLLPDCYRRGTCGQPSAAVGNVKDCHASSIKRLIAAATSGGHQFVVLHNPCGVYEHSPLYKVGVAWSRSGLKLSQLAESPEPAEIWLKSKQIGPWLAKDKEQWHRPYEAKANYSARLLRTLVDSAPGGVRVVVETQPPHFPSASLGPRAELVVDGTAGSFEMFALGSLQWLHRLAQLQPNGTDAIAAYGIRQICFSSYAQRPGNFEPSFAYGSASIACESNVSCIREMRRVGRLRAVSCSPRNATASGVDWRTLAERTAADAAGVHVLRTFKARLDRFDVHPGIQGGGTDIRHTFDCSHSSLAAGAYDAEVQALARILG